MTEQRDDLKNSKHSYPFNSSNLHGKQCYITVISHRIPPHFLMKAQIPAQKLKPSDNTCFLTIFHKYLKNNLQTRQTFKSQAEDTTLRGF